MTLKKLVLLLLLAALLAAQSPRLTIADFQLERKEELNLLLQPNALSAPPAFNADQLKQAFADPASEYRSMPLWVWNDKMDPQRMREQLAQFKQQGIGGVFIHPRPGLMTEYLGDEWFRLWKFSVEEGKRLGLLVNIYDENSYPSGFAGGHVPSMFPDTAAQYVQAELDVNPNAMRQRRGVSVSFFAVQKDSEGRVTSASRLTEGSPVPQGTSILAFRLRRASGNPWTGEFPYVDLTNPQTTPAFLDSTYEAYKREVGSEFGKTVRWAFTDEPLIATAGAYDSARLALPLSYNTLSEFRKRNGYDLANELPSLFWDVGDFKKVRFDYWQTMHDLWKENFMRPMFLWCDRNKVQFTGHWMEHEWPAPWITPADASLYAYEHVPGIDLLEGAKLRTDGKDAHLLFTIKQVASVSHQLGRRAFCEAYGVAGWDGTLEHYKRFGDWLMVHGINFMDQHLAFSTTRGARKRDHPQSFTDHSAWWPYYRTSGDHLGRVSFLSSISEARNRVLVLTPTTSGFLWARRGGATPELERMRADNAELNQFLADHQVDFDLGDEYMIEWFGKEEGKKLTIAKASYDVIVWPKNMTNVRKETVPHLEGYLANGGVVVALGPAASYVDGRQSDAVTRLQQRFADQWIATDTAATALAALNQRVPPRIRFDHQLPSGVAVMERWLPGGQRMLFFANTGLQPVAAKAAVEGGSLEAWDTISGKVSPAYFTKGSAGLEFPLELAPAGSALYLVSDAAAQPAPAPRERRFASVTSGPWNIQPDTRNVMVLDYCDLKIGSQEKRSINTWQANWTIWQSHGFERPAWDNAVQFKNRVFDRNHFSPDSGFEATYRFTVADKAALSGIQLALEMPQLYRISVNGVDVDFSDGERWLDHSMKSISIEKQARLGENTVRVTASPFDVNMELENIYVRGAFSVKPSEKGFVASAPEKIGFGSWAKQGLPFYADSVLYESELTVPAGGTGLRIALPEWQGSVVEVLLDGTRQALLSWPPYQTDVVVAAGKHTVGLRVVSTPRNIFGPYHNPSKPRMRAWPAAWAEFPENQPAGSQYDLIDYGLMKAPIISVTTDKKL